MEYRIILMDYFHVEGHSLSNVKAITFFILVLMKEIIGTSAMHYMQKANICDV